jgi:glycosyltransferase involved in cell wall biosynthesis
MARIAVVDILFNWPPDGGARTDLKEITTRLATHHDVMMFVADFRWRFPRGRIDQKLGFRIDKTAFNFISFNWYHLSKRIKEKVKRFNPDYVLIADAWYMKPHLIEALSDYPIYVREYAYESSCIKLQAFDGVNTCRRTYISGETGNSLRCLQCTMEWIWKARPFPCAHEFLAAFGFTKYYVNKAVKSLKCLKGILVYNELAKSRLIPINNRIHIIPGGIDPDLFKPIRKSSDSLGTNSILMVGRVLDRAKGFHVLHEACLGLWRQGFQFSLLCTNRDKINLKGVKSVGWLSQESLPELYAQCDICVVPSIWPEPFGIVALEAMACEKPVIVSKVGGLQHIVNDGIEGFVIDPNSPEQLQDRLSILLRDPDLMQRMGKAGRKKVLEKYTWDRIYSNYYSPLFDGAALSTD